MKKTEKAAIARIITDLIKADGIIDLREMNTLDDLQNKYDITDNDWKSGGSIHLAESLDVLKELDAETRQELLNDFCHVAMSDDFCAKEEALLLLCLQLILKPHNDFKAQILSVNSTELNFDNSQMLYVEGYTTKASTRKCAKTTARSATRSGYRASNWCIFRKYSNTIKAFRSIHCYALLPCSTPKWATNG